MKAERIVSLLEQEVFHGAKEVTEVLRIGRTTLWKWRRKYGLPIASVGDGLLTSRTALLRWIDELSLKSRRAPK